MDEPVSDIDQQKCSRLNEAVVDVRAWLNLKRRTGRYSHGFLVEMVIKSFDRTCNLFKIYDELGKLEGNDPFPSITKKPRQMRSCLKGLQHKHYYQDQFLPRNLSNEAERMVKDGRWEKMFAPHYGKHVTDFIDQITHEIVDVAYERRAKEQRMTGEFIVYEQTPEGSNYYLTLGLHGEWDLIRQRVDDYRKHDPNGGW